MHGSCAHVPWPCIGQAIGGRVLPPCLPLYSAVLTSMPASAPKPTYPVPRPPLSESPRSFLTAGVCGRAPRSTLHMLRLVRLPFSFVSLACALSAYRPTASPAPSLWSVQSLRSISPVGACSQAHWLYSTTAKAKKYVAFDRPPDRRQSQAPYSSVELGLTYCQQPHLIAYLF